MATHSPAARTRQTADHRREQVISAAIREFADNGYQAASTAAIARRAGISQPYIYALFPSKQELFIAVHDHVFTQLSESFAATALGDTPADRLAAMGRLYPTLISDRYALLVQLQSYATSEPAIRAHVARRYRELHQSVLRLSGAGREEVAVFFACGMLANVTTALGVEDICAPLFETPAPEGAAS